MILRFPLSLRIGVQCSTFDKTVMGRKRAGEREGLYDRHLQAKVTEKVYAHLKGIQQDSNCRTIGEVVRRILSRERIIVYTKDVSMQGPLEELIGIRKELRAISVNINQLTHAFHEHPQKQVFNSLRVADEYRKVGSKVDRLLALILEMGRAWSQE
jgi:hypothetical protein